jgi:mono/diheme cytochrome c family protein
MPVAAYRKLSDADARAIAAYLKSIPPVRRVAPKSAYVTPLPASYGPPVTHVGAPPVADQASYGAYLVGIAHCLLCHTPVANGHPDTSHPGAGGREYVDDHGYPIVSANITPDPVYGIGKWSDQEIKNAITMGINPNGGKLNSFMPSAHFSGMAEEDLNAIVAYLRTLKPIGNNKI